MTTETKRKKQYQFISEALVHAGHALFSGRSFQDRAGAWYRQPIRRLSNTASSIPPSAPPSAPIFVHSALEGHIANQSASAMGQSFEQVANKMIAQQLRRRSGQYPELYQWQATAAQARTGG